MIQKANNQFLILFAKEDVVSVLKVNRTKSEKTELFHLHSGSEPTIENATLISSAKEEYVFVERTENAGCELYSVTDGKVVKLWKK